MQTILTALTGAALTFAIGGGLAHAAATVDPADAAPTARPAIHDYELGTELTVENWILCTTQEYAESIARARATGVEPALKVYGDLRDTKSCGLFPQLHVILKEALYQSGPDIVHDTRVYSASVSIGPDWPTGFVVYGGLSD